MAAKTSAERMAEAMERSFRLWQTVDEAGPAGRAGRGHGPPAWTVAISREAGTDAGEVARTLGSRLGWPVYNRELLQRIADEMGLRASLLESVDERRESWLRECVEAFLAVPGPSTGAYVRHLVESLLSLAAHGECIIVGRGAAQILPAATTLRVRLIAPRETRVAAAQARFGFAPDEAARWVDDTDRQRRHFVRDHFQRDPDDPHLYDLIVSTARFSSAEAAEVIREALYRLRARSLAGEPAGAPAHA